MLVAEAESSSRVTRRRLQRVDDVLCLATMIVVASLLLVSAAFSLSWKLTHDSPLVAYMGYQVADLERMPYRDIFEVNLPGTMLLWSLFDRLVGASYLGYRCIDFFFLCSIGALTFFALRAFGRVAALLAALLFGLQYLDGGPVHALQREYTLLVPLSGAILLALAVPRLPFAPRAFLLGACFGIAATVKPQVFLSLPPCVVFLAASNAGTRAGQDSKPRSFAARLLATAFLTGAGAALPLALVALWLTAEGAWPEFLSITQNYWPLYLRLSPDHVTTTPAERNALMLQGWIGMGGLRGWFVPAALGVALALHACGSNVRKRHGIVLIASVAVTTSLYPLAAGKFWPYHWLPFQYFLCVLVSLAFAKPSAELALVARAARMGVLALVLVQGVYLSVVWQALAGYDPDPPSPRLTKITGHLRENLEPEDTVQPLDWTGGAVHAMWLVRAPLATRFLYDFPFYHHVSTPYVQSLRTRFLAELEGSRPRFVIQVWTRKPWVTGVDTTFEFTELQAFLDANYAVDLEGRGFFIWRRRD